MAFVDDSKAFSKIGATCDDVLCLLCAELDVPVPRSTPAGFELPMFWDDIDARYTEMRERLAEKAAQKQKQIDTFGGHKSKNTFVVRWRCTVYCFLHGHVFLLTLVRYRLVRLIRPTH